MATKVNIRRIILRLGIGSLATGAKASSPASGDILTESGIQITTETNVPIETET